MFFLHYLFHTKVIVFPKFGYTITMHVAVLAVVTIKLCMLHQRIERFLLRSINKGTSAEEKDRH